MTDNLADRIPWGIAIDRTLTPDEYRLFRTHVLIGPYEGAEVADWLADAVDADALLGPTGAWWDRDGEAQMRFLMINHGLPVRPTKRLLYRAVYVCLALPEIRVPGWHRTPRDVAHEAALWGRGWLYARQQSLATRANQT